MKVRGVLRLWKYIRTRPDIFIAVLYLLLALLWFPLTDLLIGWLAFNTADLQHLQLLRDWLLILTTAAFIFWFADRMRQRNRVLEAVSNAAHQFLYGPWQEQCPAVLAGLGRAVEASRCYLFRTHINNDGVMLVTQLYEWASPGVQPEIDNPALQSMDFAAAGFSRWIEAFQKGEPIQGPVSTFPAQEQGVLLAQGIRSLLCVPVRIQEELWGFLGFDDCLYPRIWSSVEVEALTTTASMLGASIQRARAEEAIRRHLNEATFLHAAALAASQISEPDELISRITALIGQVLQADHYGLLIYEEGRQALRPHPSYVIPAGESHPGAMPLRGDAASRAVLKGEQVCCACGPGEGFLPATRSEIGVPVQVSGRIFGAIHAGSALPQAFSPGDERLLSTLAGTLGTALERIEYIESERRRRHEAETLNLAAAAVSSSLDLQKVLDLILNSVQRVVPYDSAAIFLLEGGLTNVVAAKGFKDPESFLNRPLRRESPLFDEIRRTGQPIIIPDTRTDRRFVEWSETPRIRSWLGLPLVARGDVIGFLTLDSHRENTYNPNLSFLAQTFAYQAAAAIYNARLYEAEARRREEAERLRQAASDIASSLDTEQVLETVLDALRPLLPFDSAGVFLLEGDRLVLQACSGIPKEARQKIPIADSNDPLFAEIRSSGRSVILQDAQADPRFHGWGETSYTRGWMGVPLVARGEVIGYITLDSRKPGAYQPHDAELVQAFANQAAAAIQNARLYRQAVRAAERRSVLHRMSQDIVRSIEDLEQTYRAVHNATRELMECDAFVIALQDETHNRTEAVYIFEGDQRWPSCEVPPGKGLTNGVIQSRQTVLITDLATLDDSQFIHYGTPQRVRSVLATPLQVGGRVVGAISTQSYQPNAFGAEERELLELLASQAAIAVENARLFAAATSRLAELEGVARVSAILRKADTLQEMLPGLLNETLRLLNADTGGIWLYNASNDLIWRAAARGWFEKLAEVPIRPSQGIIGYTLQTRTLYICDNLKEDPHTYQPERVPEGWGGVCMPVHVGEEAVGVLFVALPIPRRLRDEELGLLNAIAEIAGNAIHRAKMYEHSQKQVRRLTILRDIDTAIASSFEAGVALNVLINHVLAELGADAADVLLLNPETTILTYQAGRGFHASRPEQRRLRIGTDLSGRAVLERRLMHSDRPVEDAGESRAADFMAEGFATWHCVPLIVKGYVKGVLEVFHRKPFHADKDWLDFLQLLAGQAAIALDNMQLFSSLQRSNQELILAYDSTLEGWGRALELRDKETQGHTQRVTELTLRLARRLRVPESELTHIRRGVLLHDIGKMGVPDHILRKTGPLDEAEWVLMRQHPQLAYDLLAPITYLRPAIDIPYCHHEKWDGSGYPRGLKGTQIPLSARIFALVDVWDALRYDRPYREAWSREQVIAYIRQESGTRFDPALVEVFLKLVSEDPSL